MTRQRVMKHKLKPRYSAKLRPPCHGPSCRHYKVSGNCSFECACSAKHGVVRNQHCNRHADFITRTFVEMWKIALCCSIAAFLLYINTIDADFAYDDSRAIVKNQDLRDETPLSNIWFDDFWGTPLRHSGSHKSYRPLVVLSFRLNHFLHQLRPGGYHLFNCLLHSLTTTLYTLLIALVAKRTFVTFIAGILFAAHPIHTEAVAGIVGRADVLCGLFYVLALVCYMRYCCLRSESSNRRFLWLSAVCVLTISSTLSKEIGITALAVCVIYDLFYHTNVTLEDLLHRNTNKLKLEGVGLLLVFGSCILIARLYFMGYTPPSFSPADNPAADSKNLLTRTLTFLYLPLVNFLLLVFPATLSFDWSMEAIPLVESLSDPRVLLTLVFYTLLIILVKHSLTYFFTASTSDYSKTSHSHQHTNGDAKSTHNAVIDGSNYSGCSYPHSEMALHRRFRRDSSSSAESICDENHNVSERHSSTMSQRHYSVVLVGLSLTILPLLPATNLFFYVGFVVAERVLYIPSMGFCLLVAEFLHQFHKRIRHQATQKLCYYSVLTFAVVLLSLRTYSRCLDWRTEESLYKSGVSVNPAKAWGNLANVLNNQAKFAEAEQAYRNALSYRGNMADVHYNLGILLQDQHRYEEALEEYRMAIECRPRLTVAHLNKGIVLALLGQHNEAIKAYKHCAEIDASGLKDPRMHETAKISSYYNLGRLHAERGDHSSAILAYNEALVRRPDYYSPQSIYNLLGESHYQLGNWKEAETAYKKSLDSKPDHIPAHLTQARLMSKTNRPTEAEKWYLKAIATDAENLSARQHYAIFLTDQGRYSDSLAQWLKAEKILPGDDFDVVFNIASAYRQVGKNHEAEMYYLMSTKLQPKSATAHMNLGAMYHMNKKYELAEKSYLRALQINPSDTIAEANLKKLRNVMQRHKR